MSVSANTLFHFTDFETLKNILRSKCFWPQYSFEHFDKALPTGSRYHSAYIPMVCFCDLKLTQLADISISDHTKHFGNYGLGFNKDWGISMKISPVSYVHEKSVASTTIERVISTVNSSNLPADKKFINNLGEIVKFLKPFTGNYQKGKKLKKNITYYDEREWRYIPKEKKYEVFPSHTTKVREKIKKLNLELQSNPLNFKLRDIRYIIIKNESEKSLLIASFSTSKTRKRDRDYLISRIISLEEIRNNF